MTRNTPQPDISNYLAVLDQLLDGSITAPAFEVSFLREMKSERRILGDPVYPILQELFEDVDAYVARPELRTEPEDLDDEQLLDRASRTRAALRALGFV